MPKGLAFCGSAPSGAHVGLFHKHVQAQLGSVWLPMLVSSARQGFAIPLKHCYLLEEGS